MISSDDKSKEFKEAVQAFRNIIEFLKEPCSSLFEILALEASLPLLTTTLPLQDRSPLEMPQFDSSPDLPPHKEAARDRSGREDALRSRADASESDPLTRDRVKTEVLNRLNPSSNQQTDQRPTGPNPALKPKPNEAAAPSLTAPVISFASRSKQPARRKDGGSRSTGQQGEKLFQTHADSPGNIPLRTDPNSSSAEPPEIALLPDILAEPLGPVIGSQAEQHPIIVMEKLLTEIADRTGEPLADAMSQGSPESARAVPGKMSGLRPRSRSGPAARNDLAPIHKWNVDRSGIDSSHEAPVASSTVFQRAGSETAASHRLETSPAKVVQATAQQQVQTQQTEAQQGAPHQTGAEQSGAQQAREGSFDLKEDSGENDAFVLNVMTLVDQLADEVMTQARASSFDHELNQGTSPSVRATVTPGIEADAVTERIELRVPIDNDAVAAESTEPMFGRRAAIGQREASTRAVVEHTYGSKVGLIDSVDNLDAESIASLVNDVLIEQARRHGIDIS